MGRTFMPKIRTERELKRIQTEGLQWTVNTSLTLTKKEPIPSITKHDMKIYVDETKWEEKIKF